MITFGTFTAFVTGREATENEQWRNVWSYIDRFRWRLDDLHTVISGDRSWQSARQCSSLSATPRTAPRMIGRGERPS